MRVHKLSSMVLAAAVACCAMVAQAATIETVWVTNPGNANDSTGYGGVGYAYEMGKYEVTNSQYCEFLSNKAVTDTYGLYNTNMASNANGGINRSGSSGSYTYAVKSGYANMPVNYVSWYDGIRFANWLQNGQGSGGTESGTYAITGGAANSGSVTVPDAATRAAWGPANKHWVLPSENEWYKSAYYQPAAQGGDTDNFWSYPTATNTVPHSDNPASLAFPTNSGNFYGNDSVANGYDDGYAVTASTSYVSTQNYLTNVGAYTQSDSFYGTFDQGGNVWEWNEALFGSSSRGLRGGSFLDYSGSLLASARGYFYPANEGICMGFRVASIPEPGSLIMLVGLALAGLLYWVRKHV